MDKIESAMKSIEEGKRIASECSYRPKYHFLPPAYWMNDPNAPMHYKGEYHIFYQHNPYGDQWGKIHWGHAKSPDLIHWEHLPIALAPSLEKGEEHCFSGNCIIHNGVPSIIYTSIGPNKLPATGAEQWLAISTDNMTTWKKFENNPILTLDVHKDLKIRDWRDPYLWKENGSYFMILGGHVHKKRGGIVLLYKSTNLKDWEFVNILCEGNRKTGKNWECPVFLRFENKYALIVSPHRKVIYALGSYKNFEFTPDKWNILDHGKTFYAPNIFVDNKDRIIMLGWIKGGGSGGWSGCMSLPRILNLSPDGEKLTFTPVSELQKLRENEFSVKNITIDEEGIDFSTSGCCLEIELVLERRNSKYFTIDLFKSSQDNQTDKINFDFYKKIITAGREKGYLTDLSDLHRLNIKIFIDHSVVEVYINKEFCFTFRTFPKSLDCKLSLICNDGKMDMQKLTIWTLKAIG
ncbi:MAG: hypothetical protein GF383_12565 [Candidatus Lokiarchaeota archaeon]|nr:hypothetical protein [Candidatus Lokiarchaeota archaeon]MBD3341858.1 hypothetical protein [Candidatus Lokiarchaeota archaeon]